MTFHTGDRYPRADPRVGLAPGGSGLGAADGQAVILGLRPEHIGRAQGAPPPGVARLDGVVELVQPTGSRTYATLRLGALPVVAELQAHDVNRPGERIGLQLDMNRAALFDAETKKAL